MAADGGGLEGFSNFVVATSGTNYICGIDGTVAKESIADTYGDVVVVVVVVVGPVVASAISASWLLVLVPKHCLKVGACGSQCGGGISSSTFTVNSAV
eukprot:scaffold5783_cov129-Amphora_coffeaeformis.AAC.10